MGLLFRVRVRVGVRVRVWVFLATPYKRPVARGEVPTLAPERNASARGGP